MVSFAQTCDTEADFTFTANGCVYDFQSAYAGAATHYWTFYRNPQGIFLASTSNLANPLHNYGHDMTTNQRKVVHTISYLQGGNTITKTCEKILTISCPQSCALNPPQYIITGCLFTPLGIDGAVTWNWGDGSPVETGINLGHTYNTSGVFTVTFTINGQTCTLQIRVSCNLCCTVDFMANIVNDCGKLVLTLDAYCDSGNHFWTVTGNSCFKLITLQKTVADQAIQITNIDTEVTGTFTITHTYTCLDGMVLSQTKQVSVLPPGEKGIFIGQDGVQTFLSAYVCVLPGFSYTGQVDKLVYVTGTIAVNKPFTFSSTDLQFHPGITGFDINFSNLVFKLETGTLARGAVGPCDLWRGLKVYSGGKLTCDDVTIRDALFGIDVTGKPVTITNLNKVTFTENYVGIYFRNNTGVFSMTQSTFDGGTGLRAAGSLLTLANSSVSIPAPTSYFDPGFANDTDSTIRGFAGIYSLRAKLTLLPLIKEKRNKFTRLNYGILAYDANIDIDKNAYYGDISPGSHNANQTAAVAMFDRNVPTNTFYMNGTLDEPNAGADITNSVYGIIARTQLQVESMSVGIQNMNMDNVRTGIFLDARFGIASITGNSSDPGKFKGITRNKIRSTLENPLAHISDGICFEDLYPTVSKVEIYGNEVISEITDALGQGWFDGQTTGIAFRGSDAFSAVAPGIDEVDIHDNRVVISGDGETGIGLIGCPNGIVRNNRDGNSSAGNGIFPSSSNYRFGIWSLFGNNNKFICNDVEGVSDPNTFTSHLFAWGTSNGEYKRNKLKGPGNGAFFDEVCFNAEYRCNLMSNNNVGLHYGDNADTGLQGSQTEASGNLWELPMTTWQAQHNSGLTLGPNSQYFVRNIASGPIIERPVVPNFSPNFLWFRTVNPGSPIVCKASDCPIPPSFNEPPVVSHTDSVIANNSGTYTDAVRWQLKFDLYRKLSDHPFLAQTNNLMGSFMTGMNGSFTASFIQMQTSMRTSFQPSDAIMSAINSNNAGIKVLTTEMATIDANLLVTIDSIQLEGLITQRVNKDSLIEILTLANQQLSAQQIAIANNTISNLVSQINAVSTTNNCESNLKGAFLAYLQSAAVNTDFDSNTRQQVKSIAEQCPSEGGIGVVAARALYQAMIGSGLSTPDCSVEGRDNLGASKSTIDIHIFPNPTDGIANVVIPIEYYGQLAVFTVHNSIGNQIFEAKYTISNLPVRLDLSKHPQGTYFISIRVNGSEVKTIPIVIR